MLDRVEIPHRHGAILGVARPIEKYCQSLLRYTLQKTVTASQCHCYNGL